MLSRIGIREVNATEGCFIANFSRDKWFRRGHPETPTCASIVVSPAMDEKLFAKRTDSHRHRNTRSFPTMRRVCAGVCDHIGAWLCRQQIRFEPHARRARFAEVFRYTHGRRLTISKLECPV